MNQIKYLLSILSIVVIATACKKDQISVQAVTKVESHTTSRLNRILFLDNNTCIIGGGERYLKAENTYIY